MWSVFALQWTRFKREPLLVLAFFALSIVFVLFLAGNQGGETITVQTFSNDLSEEELTAWLDRLNQNEEFDFERQDRETAEEMIRSNQASFALELSPENYTFLIGQESQYRSAVDQYVEKTYVEQLRLNELENHFGDNLDFDLNETFIETRVETLSSDRSASQEYNVQVIAGMTLYFVMYSVLFNTTNIISEKRTGTWNRLIFSPLKKIQIYTGQLLYFFTIGMLQILLSFAILRFGFGYDFGSQYLSIFVSLAAYIFAIVSLGMLVIGIVQSPQQLQALIPILATAMAMIGGAFWPLDLVSNRVLIALSNIVPLKYGIETLENAILYNYSVADLLRPISILAFMGVLSMGVGLNLIERTK